MASNTISSQNNQSLEENFSSNDIENAIIKTIIYSDIFLYPLKKKEIHKYLNGIKCTYSSLDIAIDNLILNGKLIKTKNYYHLPNRNSIVDIREKRILISRNLWKKALFYSSILKNLPFIKMISITGALALNNTKENDDIDFFIVTTKNRLWISRIFVVILMKLGNLKKDHLCPNYLISERNMKISKDSMYSAREIVNMIPIYNKNLYSEFLERNRWIQNHFPNFRPNKAEFQLKNYNFLFTGKKILELILSNPIFDLLDLFEMKRTSEKLIKMSNKNAENIFSRNCCKSHLEGHGNKITKSYSNKINEFI